MPDDFLREYFLFICVVSSCFVTCIWEEAHAEPHVHSVDPTARNRNLISTTKLKQTKQFQLSALPVSYFFLSVCLKIKENLEIFSLKFDRLKVLFSSVLYITSKEAHSRVNLPRRRNRRFLSGIRENIFTFNTAKKVTSFNFFTSNLTYLNFNVTLTQK